MYILVQTIKDQDGEKQVSWSAYEAEAEALSAYELAKQNPSLLVASVGRVVASTEY